MHTTAVTANTTLIIVLFFGWTIAAAEPPQSVTNSIGMKFVRLPAGTFQMGSPFSEVSRSSDETLHEITLSRAFYMGVYEVTQSQYERVTETNPSGFTSRSRSDRTDTDSFPVEQVSWDDAHEFCRRLSGSVDEATASRTYRLPTEAEWEYACRAGESNVRTAFNIGGSLSSVEANFHGRYPYGDGRPGPSLFRTTKVGLFKPNTIGLYDLHGNAWEWCSDKYNRDYYLNGPKTDPSGPRGGEQRVCRGGSWRNNAIRCRAAYRGKYDPAVRVDNVGFRAVFTIPETQGAVEPDDDCHSDAQHIRR
jgi:formylglycine-generating enzyme required for sulfatase activity